MKKLLTVVAFALMMVPSAYASKGVWVDGFTKKNGTRVDGHYRSRPDDSYNNNWSTRANKNPHTGKVGENRPLNNQELREKKARDAKRRANR